MNQLDVNLYCFCVCCMVFGFIFLVDYTFMLHFCCSSHEHPGLVNSGNIHEKCIHSSNLGAVAENMDVAMVITYNII